MKYKYSLVLIFFTLLMLNSCGDDDVDNQIPSQGNFIDHGFIPIDVEMTYSTTPFQSAIYNGGEVLVATSDGLWRNELTTKEWSRAGFEGMEVTLIFKHPTIENKLFAGIRSTEDNPVKTLHMSEDGGQTWQGVENPILLSTGGYENYMCLAVRPGHPDQIYANMEGGAMIAISLDGGMNWERMNYEEEEHFGYTSNIAFLPEDPHHIFQGSENPLDVAWLARYDINASDPVLLENFTTLMGLDNWGNRRPTELKTFSFEPNALYVGQEGALSKITGETSEYIFRANEGEDTPYSYIYGIWVNPDNTNHIIFGGSLNHNVQPMSLYETSRDGNTVNRIKDKLGLDNPQIFEIIHTDTYPAIVINDFGRMRVKLVLYNYK